MTAPAVRLCPRCEGSTTEPLCPTCRQPTVQKDLEGRYELTELLGRGGMATVWQARQHGTGRMVAVKLLEPGADPVMRARFEREARLSASLEHPNVIRVYDFGTTAEGVPYMVMEQLKGHDLRREIVQQRMLSLRRAVNIMVQVLKALSAAHARGMVHRDIKPSNIFLHTQPDDAELVKVMDFGIATGAPGMNDEAARLTSTGHVMGTPAYMSPEQLMEAPLDARSDIYSAGLVFFEMLTGKQPFTAESAMALAMKQVHERVPRIGAVRKDMEGRADVQEVVDRLLAKDPAERPVSANHAMALVLKLLPEPRDTSRPELLHMNTQDFSLMADAERAAAAGAPPPVPAEEPTTKNASTAEVLAAAGHPSRARTRGVAVAAVALVLVGGAWMVMGAGRSSPRPAGPERVMLRVRTTPAGATVKVDGAVAGTTPLEHVVEPRVEARQVTLSLPGHVGVQRSVAVQRDTDLDVLLVAEEPSPAPAPVENVVPAAADAGVENAQDAGTRRPVTRKAQRRPAQNGTRRTQPNTQDDLQPLDL